MRIRTPKDLIKYYQYLEKNNLAICDGTTVDIGIWDVLMESLIPLGFVGIYTTYKIVKWKLFGGNK
jgi:hypothetical protein